MEGHKLVEFGGLLSNTKMTLKRFHQVKNLVMNDHILYDAFVYMFRDLGSGNDVWTLLSLGFLCRVVNTV